MIRIGTDELILHMRKNSYGQGRTTAELGRLIGKQLQDWGGTVIQKDVRCHWGNSGSFVDANDLPKTATQFSFDPNRLPQIYAFLRTL